MEENLEVIETIEEQEVPNEVVVLNPKQELLGKIYDVMIEDKDYDRPSYKLFPYEERVLRWNLVRGNIEFDAIKAVELYEEEVLEGEIALEQFNLFETCDQKKPYLLEMVDSECDRFVVFTGTLAKTGRSSITAPLLMDLATQYEDYRGIPKRVEALGFDFLKCMDECLKHIESRVQDPAQALRWSNEGNPSGEKWKKDPNQPEETLYQPDYMRCKLGDCGCGK